MKKSIYSMFIAMLLLSGRLMADDQADLQQAATDLDKNAQTTEGRTRVLDQISQETKVPVTTLQEQQTKTKFGYGELLIANSLASASGKTFDQIAALKASGEGWGKIANDNNLKLGALISQAHHANEGATAMSDLQKHAADLDKNAQTADGRQRVLTQISQETKVPVATLQEQQTKTKFGYGELLIANSLATGTGKTFDQIAALKASGVGWGKIANDNNVKLGDVVSKVKHASDGSQPPNPAGRGPDNAPGSSRGGPPNRGPAGRGTNFGGGPGGGGPPAGAGGGRGH